MRTNVGQISNDEKPGLSHAAHMDCIMHLGNLVLRQSVKTDNHASNKSDDAFIKATAELFNQINESS